MMTLQEILKHYTDIITRKYLKSKKYNRTVTIIYVQFLQTRQPTGLG